jgi:hypothetical protein
MLGIRPEIRPCPLNSGRRGRTENLKPWPKGISGNLSGRPKSKRLSEAHKHRLEQLVPGDAEGRTWAELIAEAQIRTAAHGNVQAARELADRTTLIQFRYSWLKTM